MSEPKPIHIVLILLGLVLVMLFVVAQARGGRSKQLPTLDDLEQLGESWGSSFTRPALLYYDEASAACVSPQVGKPLADGAKAELAPGGSCLLRFKDSGLLPKSLRVASVDGVAVIARLTTDDPIEQGLKLQPSRPEATLSLGKKTAELDLACPTGASKPCLVTLGEPSEP